MLKKALFLVGVLCGVGFAACMGPYCYDDTGAVVQGGIGIGSVNFTVSTSTPTKVGVVILDSNYKLYVATCTTFAGSFCWVQPKSQ